MDVVRVDSVSKTYLLGKQRIPALSDVSLIVMEGEFLAIAGPSGSGKSTLLNLIGCLDVPSSGKIYLNEQDISNKDHNDLAELRASTIGFIFQTFNLLPVLSAAENIEYPLLNIKNISKRERQERVQQYLHLVGLEKFARHKPNELSGGQRQRVAIARALATRPKIVLADEPTANLDHTTGEGILALMKEINRNAGVTFIFSTHDPKVLALADRVVNISDGEVIV